MTGFRLPPRLLERGFALREERDDDVPFLIALYAAAREPELAMVTGWSAARKRDFIAQQFAAQRHHYRTHIPGCRFTVIALHGEPVGRLYRQTRVTQWRIVDIALIPARRGEGTGSAILEALIAAAAAEGKGVGLFVEHYNPALTLYRRLGFAAVADTGVYLEMERAPDRPSYDARPPDGQPNAAS